MKSHLTIPGAALNRRRLTCMVCLMLIGLLLATPMRKSVFANGLVWLGVSEQSGVGKVFEWIAPHTFTQQHQAAVSQVKAAIAVPTAPTATITVTSASDAAGSCPGASCTLRAAIEKANTDAGADTINFNISGAGIKTITVTSQLPDITETLTIDGCTQPGATCSGFTSALLIQLRQTGGVDDGLVFAGVGSSGSTVRGLVVNSFLSDGIVFTNNANNNTVQCNYLGTNISGTAAAANHTGLKLLDSSNNFIGTNGNGANDANEGNLISGNSDSGISIDGTGTGNVVAGNRIGTNVAGTAIVANANFAGIFVPANGNRIGTNADGVSDALEANLISGNSNAGVIMSGSNNTIAGNLLGMNAAGTAMFANLVGIFISGNNNQIGGGLAAQRNVISGSSRGIEINANGNKVQGNYIGTNPAGTVALPNQTGVFFNNSANNNLVGTDGNGVNDAAEGNLISGNTGPGVYLLIDANNNTVAGNWIGVKADGVSALGNESGIYMTDSSSNNTIGGIISATGNLIAFNTLNGINLQDTGCVRNRILGNRIHSNGNSGIGTDAGGVAPNDPGDADTGPNNRQNFPVLTGVTMTTISGTLDSSVANSAYPIRIEFFANAACDANDNGEGEVYLGFTSLAAPGSFSFNYTPVAGKLVITSTATDANGNTSAFSACRAISPPTITAAGPLTRIQGTTLSNPANNAVVATVSDGNSGTLTVTQTGGSPGVNALGFVNTNGTVTANVGALCSAAVGANTITLTVVNGTTALSSSAVLTVNVISNTSPTVTYNNASVVVGNALTVNPATGPTNNINIGFTVQSVTPSPAPATITVNSSTGVVTVPNNVPPGSYTVTIRSTDNCALVHDATFTLNVTNTPPTITAQAGVTRHQGAGSSNSQIATVSDAESGVNGVTVKVNNASSATVNGVTVSNIANSGGTVTADIVATCGASNASFTLTATDAHAATATTTLNVTVTGITLSALVNGLTFVPYSQTLMATGGSGAYTFSLVSGTLPPGLTLNGNVLSGTPTAAGASTFTIRADDDSNTCFGERVYTINIGSTGLMYYPLARPVRLLDTRPGASPNACYQPNAPITGGSVRTQPARGTCEGINIPANATTITGHITTVQSGGGSLTLYPSDAPQPNVTNSNYLPNEILNNAFTVGLGVNDGAFKLFVGTNTDIVIDVTGYYAPPGASGLYFHPLPKPIRLLDTRTGFTGCQTPGAPLQTATTRTQTGVLTCDGVTIPTGALALVGNATTTNSTGSGYLTLWPADANQPFASSSNFAAGINRNAPFTVGLSLNGEFNIYTARTTDLVIDVMGYYSTQATDANGQGLLFNSLGAPLRLMDTRAAQPACYQPGAPMTGGTVYTQETQIPCTNLTSAARALVGNVSALNVTSNGYLTFWPSNATQPTVATSNYQTGRVFNRHFTVGLGNDVAFKRFAATTTDVIIDISGFFAP